MNELNKSRIYVYVNEVQSVLGTKYNRLTFGLFYC